MRRPDTSIILNWTFLLITWPFSLNNQIRIYITHCLWAGIAQSAERLAMGWTVRGLNLGGGEIFRTCPDRPLSPPTLLYNGYRVFPRGKAAGTWSWPPTPIQLRGQGKSRTIPRKSRTIPRFPFWAFVTCPRVNFTFTYYSLLITVCYKDIRPISWVPNLRWIITNIRPRFSNRVEQQEVKRMRNWKWLT